MAVCGGFGATGGIARIRGKVAHIYNDAEASPSAASPQLKKIARTRSGSRAAAVVSPKQDRWEKLARERTAGGRRDERFTWTVPTRCGSARPPACTGDRKPPKKNSRRSNRPTIRLLLSISEDLTGRIWMTIRCSVQTVGYRPIPAGNTEAGRGYRVLHDRSAICGWPPSAGSLRVRHADTDPARATIEKTTVLSGLSSDAVRSVFEDRDGNIWAGTTEGVDRLVPHRITPWTGLGIVGTIAAALDNRIWAGTAMASSGSRGRRIVAARRHPHRDARRTGVARGCPGCDVGDDGRRPAAG